MMLDSSAKSKPGQTFILGFLYSHKGFPYPFCAELTLCAKPTLKFTGLAELEAADCVFTYAAEVEGAVVFDDVGDLGVAVGWAVLEVFDDFAL